MLSGLRPGVARAAALPARRADQARGARARRRAPGSRSPSKRREPGPLLSRRRGQALASSPATAGLGDRPGDDRRPRRPRARRATAATTTSRSASAAGSASASREPLYVLATDAEANTVVVGAARASSRRAGCGSATATLHRPGGTRRPGPAALPLAAARLRGSPRGRRRRARTSSSSSSPSPPTASRPGQTACLMSGDVVVGRARSPDRTAA